MRATTLAHKIRNLIAIKYPAVADFDLMKLQQVIEEHEKENETIEAARQRTNGAADKQRHTEQSNALKIA